MVEWKYAAICARGHVVGWKTDFDELVQYSNCSQCGAEIHKTCPACGGKTVVAARVKYRDGSADWKRDQHCRNCGEAFPWGPGWLAQKLRRKRVTSPGPKRPTPRQDFLTYAIRERLKDRRYGHEVIGHIKDGNECYKNWLWHPALAMYVHAIEWTIIAYLEDVVDFDVIAEELQGNYFYLAGKRPNLLNKLRESVDVDQKTVERIEDLNRSERRWMAHHRSGETLREDVDAVHSRLGVLLGTLFESDEPSR